MSLSFNFLSFFRNISRKEKKEIQRCVLTSKETIVELLKNLQQHIVIITAKFPSNPEIYNTSIIKVDYKNKLFFLDELLPDEGNAEIKKYNKVQLIARLDGAILTMHCILKQSGEEKGFPYYSMNFPARVKSIQRRESYRINIPLNKRFKATIQTESGSRFSGHLNDISFSGISIRLERNQNIDLKAGDSIPFLTLYLYETITCELEIRRITTLSNNILIAGHLVEVSPVQQRIIQKFIITEDREKQKIKAFNH